MHKNHAINNVLVCIENALTELHKAENIPADGLTLLEAFQAFSEAHQARLSLCRRHQAIRRRLEAKEDI